jgi:hypothetical protein
MGSIFFSFYVKKVSYFKFTGCFKVLQGHVGQFNPQYYAKIFGSTVFVTKKRELVYSLRTKEDGGV